MLSKMNESIDWGLIWGFSLVCASSLVAVSWGSSPGAVHGLVIALASLAAERGL